MRTKSIEFKNCRIGKWLWGMWGVLPAPGFLIGLFLALGGCGPSLEPIPCSSDVECDDGSFCDGVERCIDNECRRMGPPCSCGCDEATDTCTGCCTNSDCDDGFFCTGIERCVGGECVAGDPPCEGSVRPGCSGACSESTDSCAETCVRDADCDNGLFCDGVERCNDCGVCVDGETPCVFDGRECPQNCSEVTDECVVLCEDDDDCADNLFCNGDQFCDECGACQSTGNPCDPIRPGCPAVCDEDNNRCLTSSVCVNNFECDDGVFCNGQEVCDDCGLCDSTDPPCGELECDEFNDRCLSP